MTLTYEIRIAANGVEIYCDGNHYMTVSGIGAACSIVASRHADEVAAAAKRKRSTR
jgi:hypothetical protein